MPAPFSADSRHANLSLAVRQTTQAEQDKRALLGRHYLAATDGNGQLSLIHAALQFRTKHHPLLTIEMRQVLQFLLYVVLLCALLMGTLWPENMDFLLPEFFHYNPGHSGQKWQDG